MNIGWPEGIYLALLASTLGFVVARHGQVRDDRFNFPATAVMAAVVLFLLWWGGFFA